MMNRNKRFWPFLRGKGFYIALALCIAGAGAAAWLTAQKTMTGIKNSIDGQSSVNEEAQQWDYEDILDQQTKGEASAKKPSSGDTASVPQDSSSGTASAVSSASEQQAKSGTSSAFSLSLPVKGTEVLAAFSSGKLVKNDTLHVWRTHDGIDIAANKGDPVCAVAPGKVLSVENDPMWGGVVKIEHGAGYVSIYCGVSPEKALKSGESVTSGQVLGSLDAISSEVAMASHLHFALTKDGSYIDPLSLLKMS